MADRRMDSLVAAIWVIASYMMFVSASVVISRSMSTLLLSFFSTSFSSGVSLIEAMPGLACGSMCAPSVRVNGSDGPASPCSACRRLFSKVTDHCFDAVISAYTAFLWARDGWDTPGGVFEDDGWIVAPQK